MNMKVGTCTVCTKSLFCAPGQRIRFHKECRKEGRKKFGRTTHTRKVENINGFPVVLE